MCKYATANEFLNQINRFNPKVYVGLERTDYPFYESYHANMEVSCAKCSAITAISSGRAELCIYSKALSNAGKMIHPQKSMCCYQKHTRLAKFVHCKMSDYKRGALFKNKV